MHPTPLLLIYCALSVVASLSGGWIPLVFRLTHRRMQIAISFVSGMILGIGLLHLLPHSFLALGSIDTTVFWVLAGFLFMFFLERFFHFHHHDILDDEAHASCQHDHDHDHGHAHPVERPSSVFAWGGAVIGLTLHGLIDGVTMAAAVSADAKSGLAAWAGLGAFLAIVLHKPFDSLTIGTLMAANRRSPAVRHLFNVLYSLVTPLGVVLFFLIYGGLDPSHDGLTHEGLGRILGFAAGAFLCIATSDLLPELQFHRHDRAGLSVALIAGIALAWSTVFLEESGHDHGHDHAHQPAAAAPAADHDHRHDDEHHEH